MVINNMNSTTGDFSDIKKSALCEEIYKRCAYSAAKRKPRKLINLKPLNISGLKKEIEEATEEDEKEGVTVKVSNENENIAKETSEVPDSGDNSVPETCTDLLRDITNLSSSKCVATFGSENIETNSAFRQNSNRNCIPEVKEISLISEIKKNDSFELDFSALSLSTPVKQNDVQIGSNVRRSQQLAEPFQQFITPKINNILPRNHRSLTKKSTPINLVSSSSAKKLITPYKPLVTHKMSPTPEMEEDLKTDESRNCIIQSCPESKLSTPTHKVSVQNKFEYKSEDPLCSFPMNALKDETFKRIKVNETEYVIFDIIGRGGSSEVYHCYNLNNRQHVAVKCVSLQNSVSASGYINEVKLLQQLQSCDKIIKMYDYEIAEHQKKLLVVLEHGGEDLAAILKQLANKKSRIPMYMLLFYWMEMLYAVKQIHSHGIIHSDIKPANFLKVGEGLKLIDFGIAAAVQTDMTSVIKTKQEGSCNYISPEALSSDSSMNQSQGTDKYKIHYKSDVWSLGCILYQFVYRRTPFQHITQLWPKLAAIMNPEHKIDYPDVERVSPRIIATIKKCLQYNVKSRPSIDELIAEYDNILSNI